MALELTISSIIRRYIKLRGKTLKEVAGEVKYNYKTLSGILNRDAVSAELLLRLANLLNMDLDWMSELFSQHATISPLAPLQVPRMHSDLREHDSKQVVARLDEHIRANPHSIADVKRELLKEYRELYYLLDILIPEDYVIRITVERGKEKYYCHPVGEQRSYLSPTRGRSIMHFYEGNELLSRIIAKRKDEINESSVL